MPSILVLYAGATLGGLLGALFAIPLAAVIKVFIIQVLAPAVRRQMGAEEVPEGEA